VDKLASKFVVGKDRFIAGMRVLATARLTLTEMADDDLDDVADLLGNDEVMAFYPRPKTREEAADWIKWNRRLYTDHGFGLWLMRLTETGEFIGECGLTAQSVDGVDEVEVGYHVRPEHQRRGYATEAAAACRALARDRFAVTRLIAIINPDNRPSQSVAEKIGLRLEKQSTVHGQRQSIYVATL